MKKSHKKLLLMLLQLTWLATRTAAQFEMGKPSVRSATSNGPFAIAFYSQERSGRFSHHRRRKRFATHRQIEALLISRILLQK